MATLISSDLLEREGELDAVEAIIGCALAGTGGTLLLEGPSGIGKTALLEIAAARAADAGMTVLSGQARGLETGYAWSVVRDLFEPALRQMDTARRAEVLRDAAALAAPALGYVGDPGASDEASFSTVHGLYWLTLNLADQAPVLLLVDDVHWADRPSARFLAYLMARVAGTRITVIVASRPTNSEPGAAQDVIARLALEPSLLVRRLPPLSLAAAASLVHRHLAVNAPPAVCSTCHEMTGGNPFLLRALISELADARLDLSVDSSRREIRRMTPDVVSRTVLVRLAGLSPDALSIARAIAVLDGRADIRRVSLMAGIDSDQAASEIANLVRADILVDGEALRFVHPLVRSAIDNDLSSADRGHWHRRAATLIAADRLPVGELAAHLLASAPCGDQWVVEMLLEAAAQTRNAGAPEIAVQYLERALREPPDDRWRAEVLLALGSAEAIGTPDQCLDPPGDADEVPGTRHIGDALALADSPRRRAEISLQLGTTFGLAGHHGRAVDMFERALGEDLGDDSLRSRLEAELAGHCLHTADKLTLGFGRLATVDLDGAADSASEHLRRVIAAFALISAGRIEPAKAAAIARAAAANHQIVAGEESSSLSFFVAETLIFADDLDGAITVLDGMIADARRRGSPRGAALASAFRAQAALRLGSVLGAESDGRAALEVIDTRALGYCRPYVLSFLIDALIERAELDEAERLLSAEPPSDEWPQLWQYGLLLGTRGRLRSAQGRYADAAADFTDWGRRVSPWIPRNPASVSWRSEAALAIAALDKREEARRLADWELRHAREIGSVRPLARALRTVAAIDGSEAGIAHLREALELLEVVDAPLDRARTLFELGAIARRHGERAQARVTLEIALDLAHRSGALALADRIRSELRIAGARPRRDALRGRDALTASELRVARLAADGQTNREIAQSLFVTPRTVEQHLTNAYAKLGIASRHALADALDLGRPPT